MSETQSAQKDDLTLLDVETLECPYDLYQELRDERPVYYDPKVGQYVVTRYDILREVLTDPKRFCNDWQRGAKQKLDTERQKKVQRIYEEKGWVPEPTLDGRDAPEHTWLRALFDDAFRASRIKAMDPFVKEVAYRTLGKFKGDGHCDWVEQFAVPFPLIVIGRQMGAKEEDIWKIKGWTDAWIQRFGMMQTEEEELWSAEMEVEAQHYFQPIFEELRRKPNDTLLSDLVNKEVPEWGRCLSDNELHAFMMADTFVGGSETTTNALSSGMMLLCQNPKVWDQLKTDREKYLRTFIEEVLRLESPVQGLFRVAAEDVTLEGVDIPKGSVIHCRFGAANRDERHFECPADMQLDRRNAGSHLGFGSGVHHCLGAPLARRELWWGFNAVLDNMDSVRLAPGKNDLKHHTNLLMRALQKLHIEFEPTKG